MCIFVDINEGQEVKVDMTLPLLTYLETQILQFQVTKRFSDNHMETTPWLEWNLQTQKVVISSIWELIQ